MNGKDPFFDDFWMDEEINEKKSEQTRKERESGTDNLEKSNEIESIKNTEETVSEVNNANNNISQSCFLKERPEFDLEVYDYLIKKGVIFRPRQRWDKSGSKDCFLFTGNERYITITPYKESSIFKFIPVIFLSITQKGCFVELIYDKKEKDGSVSSRIKCLKCIIEEIYFNLKNAGYTFEVEDNEYVTMYRHSLNPTNWQLAVDEFYDKIVPIIDESIRNAQCPDCESINIFITEKEFETYKRIIEAHIRDKSCRSKNNNLQAIQDNKKIHPLNLILYGPPGTSKTYNVINHAVAIVESKPVDLVKNENRDLVLNRYNQYIANGQIVFTTFHPSYSYEDFIEGLKAKVENGQVQYYIEDGVFKSLSNIAKNNSYNNYVIIIDEINRGNIPSIFGELITLIEEDKRAGNSNAISVKLPYSKEEFSVPSNLYILGTMNTADRSIALLDIALRRRFEFEELMPQPDFLRNIDVIDESGNLLNIDLEKLLKCLNEKIENELDRDKTIGHTYFLAVAENRKITLKNLNKIFKNKIIPLLQEYFYDNWDKIREILNDVNTGYFINQNKPYISEDLKNLNLKEIAFQNIYRNCGSQIDEPSSIEETIENE